MNACVVALIVFALCVCGTHAEYKFGECQKGHPVVMVPGIFGTVLNIEADIPSSVSVPWYCKRKISETRLWINAAMQIELPCFYTYIGENFSIEKKKWEHAEGVNITVAKWGTTYAVDTLDPSALLKKAIPYYHDMIEALKKVGYIDGVNMVGGGYLWHEVPTDEWAHRLMSLVEDMYSKNGNTPVIMVCHSMGAPFSYFMLQTAGDEWIKKYIHKLIYVAPAWMGSLNALNFMFDGFDHAIPIAGKVLAPLSRHIPTVWMLLPWADAFKGDTMATSPSKNYTFDMLAELLKDIGADYVDEKLESTMGIYSKYNNYAKPPPVPVITHLGTGLKTVESIYFKKDLKPCDPDGTWTEDGRNYGDGDGTVPIKSLKYPTEKWAAMGVDVKTYYHDGGEHVKMLYDPDIIQSVVDEAC